MYYSDADMDYVDVVCTIWIFVWMKWTIGAKNAILTLVEEELLSIFSLFLRTHTRLYYINLVLSI